MIPKEELSDLSLLENVVWKMLSRGAKDPKHGFYLMNLATVNQHNEPKSRTVVLRECDFHKKSLSFHTDVRSGKMTEIRYQKKVALHFWDKKSSLQIRAEGECLIHHQNEESSKKLSSLSPQQKSLYESHISPGIILQNTLSEKKISPSDPANHFCWVDIQIQRVEILHLGREGIHTRAFFTYENHQLHEAAFLKA